MTALQIIDAMAFYGADAAVLAVVTCATVQLLKLTLFKKLNKKALAFIPFLVGTLYFALYTGLCNLSVTYVFQNYAYVLERGFSVGALSTFLYVCFERLINGGGKISAKEVIASLIEAYMAEEKADDAAEKVAQSLTDGGDESAVLEILSQSAAEGVGEEELKSLAALVVKSWQSLGVIIT